MDEDCDGTADDEPVDSVWYQDGDADGWGGAARATCWPTADDVSQGGDCDDTRADVNPGAAEACDAEDVDEDCDGLADQDDPDAAEGASTWYIDDDADGFGSANDTIAACEAPDGYVTDDQDCDDTDPGVHPDGQEVCSNGRDDDCDGTPGDCARSGDVAPAEADAVIAGWGDGDLGSWLAFVGDMDGDGFEDLAVSAMELSVAGGQGAVFLFSAPTGPLDTSDAYAQLTGEGEGDRAGERIAGAGDVDGDTWPDLVVAAPGRGSAAGAVYVVHGPLSGTRSLGTASATLLGEVADDGLGLGLGAAGDVDGDGFADVLVSAYGADTGGADAGAAWLLWGGQDGLGELGAGERWVGESAGDFLLGASGDGDLDGDGFIDVVLTAPGWDGLGVSRGAAWVILGPSVGRDLADADARIGGSIDGGFAGYSVALAGDTNGDGFADLALGVPGDAAGTGAVALFHGPVTGVQDTGAAVASLAGDDAGDGAGTSVARAGDVDGNGTADLLVGAPDADGGRGAAWLVRGPFAGTASLSAYGARLLGEADGDGAGWAVAGGGDVNADGLADVAVGARYVDAGGPDGGAAYVLFGLGL